MKSFDRRQDRFFCFFAGRRQKEQAMPSYPRLSLGSHLRLFSFVFSSSDAGFWRAGRLGCVFRRQIECGLRFAGAGGLSGRWKLESRDGPCCGGYRGGNLPGQSWSYFPVRKCPIFCDHSRQSLCPQCFHTLPSHQKTFLKLRICCYQPRWPSWRVLCMLAPESFPSSWAYFSLAQQVAGW